MNRQWFVWLEDKVWTANKIMLFSLTFSVLLTTLRYQFGRVGYKETCMKLSKIFALYTLVGLFICGIFLLLCTIFGDWCRPCKISETATGTGEQQSRNEEILSGANNNLETVVPPLTPKSVRSETPSRVPSRPSAQPIEPTLREQLVQRPSQLSVPKLFDQLNRDRPSTSNGTLQPLGRGDNIQSQTVIPSTSQIISKPTCSGQSQHCLETPVATASKGREYLGIMIAAATIGLTGFMIYRFIDCKSKPGKIVLAVAAEKAAECINKAEPKL